MLDRLRAMLGAEHVLTGADCAAYSRDWIKHYHWTPLAVLRPGNTAEVAAVMALAHAEGVPVVPLGGHTGLVGGTRAEGALMLSLARLNRLRALRPDARVVVAEAGTVIQTLHEAAAEQDLYFPLWFGARGSAMLGGALSTNAGGSNVLRYGSTRALCLGLEVVLADGRVLDLLTELHKDNSGYALKDLFIGAEGTLGVITAAAMKLVPAPRAHATAMVAVSDLAAALALLRGLQLASGGLVEAFEFMPRNYMTLLASARPDLGQPFAEIHDITLLIELAATAPRDCDPLPDGSVPLTGLLEAALAAAMERGEVLDAVMAGSQAQRAALWARREVAAELSLGGDAVIDTDIALPLQRIAEFLEEMPRRLAALDAGARDLTVGHLGDGNLHYTVYASDPAVTGAIRAAIDALAVELGGSFSAEHGIGLAKLPGMAAHKSPVALDVMRAVKAALDPGNILNPGKILPPETAA